MDTTLMGETEVCQWIQIYGTVLNSDMRWRIKMIEIRFQIIIIKLKTMKMNNDIVVVIDTYSMNRNFERLCYLFLLWILALLIFLKNECKKYRTHTKNLG